MENKNSNKMKMKTKPKDNIVKMLVYLSTLLTLVLVVFIIGFIFLKGFPSLSGKFFVSLFPMIVTTVLSVLISLLFCVPIGIFSAVYLNEYAKQGKLVTIIRFCIESLVGIPSIIYGLFGMLFFVTFLKMGFSILAGCLTLSIIVLPTIIKMTEEALKTVPVSFREGSLALGASKLRTIMLVVLPSANKGIVNGIILGIGRIVGESAAVYMTIGMVPDMPHSIMSSARTLSVHMYTLASEGLSMGDAYGTALVLVLIVIFINYSTYAISRNMNKNR